MWQLKGMTVLFSLTDDRLFINCGGEAVPVGDMNYSAALNPNGSSTFFHDEKGGWGYSSMGLINSYKGPLRFIIRDTCNLSMGEAVLLESARVAPISLKYYGFCFSNGTYTVKLSFSEIRLSKNSVFPVTPRRVFDIDIQVR